MAVVLFLSAAAHAHVGCFLMTKEIWKEKKCYENVLVRDADGLYKIELCGKSPTHRVQNYDYWFYLCDEHKNLYPSSKPIIENNTRVLFSPRLRWQVMERDGFKCVRCGRTTADGIKLHVDHIHPKSRGGMATLDNGQTLCDECNIGKGARIPETHPTQLAPDRLWRG